MGILINGKKMAEAICHFKVTTSLLHSGRSIHLKRLKYLDGEVGRGEKIMENIYAAMLLHKANKPIDEASVTKVLEAAGLTVDAVQVKALVASLSEVNIDEAIKAAPAMMAAAPAAAPAAGESKPAAAPAEDKKKKAEEEKAKEEAALEGLGALFG